MPINESVYGNRENWIVPTTRTEQNTYISGISYDNTIDDVNRVKIANYNTVENPRTLMRTQMSGDSHAGGYVINNGWLPTQTDTMDNSIVQFGIGSQSGLSNIEWWGEVWTDGTTQPEMGSHDNVEIINTDTYEVTNIAFAFNNTFRPSLYATSGNMAGNGYMNPANWQYLNMQLWGDSRCFYSSQIDVVPQSAYAFTSLITQIPIKNIKIYPVIGAYNSQMRSKEYSSIQDYLADKSNYPFIYCIYAKFATNTGESWTPIDISPWFFNKTIIAKGFGNGDIVRDANIMYLRTRDLSGGFFVIGGCPNFNSQTYYQTNGFYWHYNTASVNFDVAELMPVYQPEDLKFDYDTTKNAFICDVSNMSNDQITEGIRTQLASFGLFFVDSVNDLNLPLDDEKTFLGILKDGVGYGDYSNGAKNREQDQWNWDTMEENSYDPSNPPKTDPNTYENTSGFNPAINAPDGFNKRYVLSELDIRTLREDFFKALESKPEDIDYINYTMSEFLTNNPVDCIVSLKWFPFTVPSHGQEVNINLGNYQTNVHAPVYTGSGVEVYSLGSCVIYPYAGSGEPCFLDYAPYTKIELIIPYCGTVELDPSIYMNHTLSVNFIVDIYTGACTAYIMCEGLVSDSVSGVCCVDLPISGIDNATLEGQIYNASLNLKSSKIGEAVSVVSGGLSFGTSLLGVKGSSAKMAKGVVGTVDALTGAIGSVAQSSESLAMNQYQIEHINIPFRTVGSQTGLGNAKQEQFCRLLIYRPKFINGLTNIRQWYNSNEGKLYGHTVGYSCIKTDTISSFHGFTMFSNADLSGINATDTEKSAILTALQSGVILP